LTYRLGFFCTLPAPRQEKAIEKSLKGGKGGKRVARNRIIVMAATQKPHS
jgi:hypothetical protein